MWSLIASAASSASGLLVLLAVVGGLVGAGAYGQHRLDEDSLDKLKASYATAEEAAVAKAAATQKQVDQISLNAAATETAAQTALTTHLSQEPVYVIKTVASNCVPYGLVRVLDAAASGRITASLTLPAGKSDDACAPVTWAALERSVVANYYTGLANAEQLNRLVGVLQAEQKELAK
jgi:hypothetical protein